jgi:hypothetical protein
MKNGDEMRIGKMTNFKCQSTNVPFHRNENPRNQNGKIQMPNVKFYYFNFNINLLK